VQPCDVPLGHRSRRETYMVQSSGRQHPMKMVGRLTRGIAAHYPTPWTWHGPRSQPGRASARFDL